MKLVGLIVMLVAAPASFASAADCVSKWPVSREQALFAQAPAAEPGGTLSVGSAVSLNLKPVDQVGFAVAPTRKPAAGTFGASMGIAITKDEVVQVTSSDEAWIDVIQNGKGGHVAGFTSAKGCPGVRKSVRFDVTGGEAILQISGAHVEKLTVAVLPPS